MRPADVSVWLGIAAALLAAGMAYGSLTQRVTQLERMQRFMHGSFPLPSEAP